MNEPVIRLSSPEAATYRTDIKGWVSRHGRYYGDDPGAERVARWDGATIGTCEACGADCTKHWLKCDRCREAAESKAYWARPSKPYDGGMVYSESRDKYYDSIDEAIEDAKEDYAEDEEGCGQGVQIADLRLMHCKPVYARTLDADFFEDNLPSEDFDIPQELEDAIEAFNKAVAGVVLSWDVDKYRVATDIEAEQFNTRGGV